MEPITIWREDGGRLIERPDDGTGGMLPGGAWTKLRALPRADFDALIAQRDGATARADAASERLARAEALVAAAANATSVHADLVALLMEASDLMFDRELFPVCNSAAPLRWRERVDSILEKPNG